jgi:uncharacterized protein (UPF0297 family)
MKNQNRVNAGKTSKLLGHHNEHKICSWLNETFDGSFIVDGKPNTKVDILDTKNEISYSVKSVSKKHTQCHLTSSKRWCEHFQIDGKLGNWFMQFFGVPGIDVSEGKSRRHRLTRSQIEFELNDLAYSWFNDHMIEIFDIIIARGMNNTPVNKLIWHQKSNDQKQIYDVNDLRELVKQGEWIMNETTLHFIIDENKMFHLQMKGSGKKYTSGYHSMMFHVHKCF